MIFRPVKVTLKWITVILLVTAGSSVLSARMSNMPAIQILFGVIDLPPYTMASDEGLKSGLLFETSEVILENAGFETALQPMPIRRLLKEVTEGRIDCSLIAGTPLVKKTYNLIEPLGEELVAGILPHKSKVISSYEDIQRLTIAVPQGVIFHPRFDNDLTIHKVKTNGYDHALILLALGRVDAVAGSITTYRITAGMLGAPFGNVFGDPLVFYKTGLWFGCSPKFEDSDTIARLQASIIELRDSGKIASIFDSYRKPSH